MELNQVIAKYEKGKIELDNVLSSKIFSNNKYGLDFLILINLVQVQLSL